MYENENVEQLVSQAVALDKEQKYCKRKLDTVKAKLQSKGLAMIDDRNVKYIKFYSEDGSVAVGDSYKILFLTVSKNKIAATPENIGVVAILTVVLNYSILFPSFTFFLDGFHLAFGDKFEICIKTTDLM